MTQPLITVIVPVYKVEQYLNRCVDSIINQTYKNLEIILVDDGSPDRCGEICEEFAKADSRIRVIHKENGGLSSARNAGLDIMTGEYVGFVDSDDWIEPTMYEVLYNNILKSNAEISACGIQCDHSDGTYHFFNSNYPKQQQEETFIKTTAIRELIIAEKITNSACDKLFSKEIFANLRFRCGIVNEDFELMPQCIEKAEKVIFTPAPFYHYVMTEQSIMRGAFKESRFTEAEISRNHMQYYKEKYPELYNYAVAKHVEICLVLIHASSQCGNFEEKRKQIITEVKKSDFKTVFELLDTKTKIKYVLSKINIKLYIFVMDLWNKSKE